MPGTTASPPRSLSSRFGRGTFFDYKQKYRQGFRGARHGNSGQCKLRPATVQAEGTVLAIVNDTCNVMPATRMKGIGDGRQDVQKYLPVSFTWKVVRDKVNNVSRRCTLLCFNTSPYFLTGVAPAT